MPKFGESLTKISLRDLLNEQELTDIRKYKQFKTGQVLNSILFYFILIAN